MSCSTCNIGCKQPPIPNSSLSGITGGFLNITQRCNLKCKYCFVVQQPMEMTYEVAKDAADFYAANAIKANDIPSINFFGGEPLLRWDDIMVPLTKYIRSTYPKYILGVTTNGTLLTADKIAFMKEHNISILFSIDGDKKTQDLNRPFHSGKGSFDSIVDKIDMVLEYNPNATFRATVDHDNVYDMADNYAFAISKGYNNVFMIPNIFAEWSLDEKKELEVQLTKIADIYMDTIRKGKPVSFSGFRDSFKKINKINQAEHRQSFRDTAINIPAYGKCGLGATKYASVGASGTLYSCQELTESPTLGDKFSIGNIYTGVDESKRRMIIEKFDPRMVSRSDGVPCSDCLLYRVCDGGCTINNYLANGDLNIMSDVLCLYYQLTLNQSIRIMNIMAEEDNKIFRDIFRRQ